MNIAFLEKMDMAQILSMYVITTFRMNIPDSSDDDPIVAANHGLLYQNQEGDPEVQEMIRTWWEEDDTLSDLPPSSY